MTVTVRKTAKADITGSFLTLYPYNFQHFAILYSIQKVTKVLYSKDKTGIKAHKIENILWKNK